ncbi:hypothetical protein SDC9_116012 [bioreactor metagenome]|uniref:Uncharacterized protein n=1 Tax=bioreactor metagenome TaxID=1076179 RepID=A0A645BVF6_9ZZZZ
MLGENRREVECPHHRFRRRVRKPAEGGRGGAQFVADGTGYLRSERIKLFERRRAGESDAPVDARLGAFERRLGDAKRRIGDDASEIMVREAGRMRCSQSLVRFEHIAERARDQPRETRSVRLLRPVAVSCFFDQKLPEADVDSRRLRRFR